MASVLLLAVLAAVLPDWTSAARLKSEASIACKSLADLATLRQTTPVGKALDTWCGDDFLQAPTEVKWPFSSDWRTCILCNEACQSKNSSALPSLYLHWDRGKALKGRPFHMVLGGQNAASVRGERCTDWKMDGDVAESGSIGDTIAAFTEPCTAYRMKRVAYLRTDILMALGVQNLEAVDISWFRRCGQSSGEAKINSLPLRVAARGSTLYQSWYGDAFKFESSRCQGDVDHARQVAVQHGLDAEAEHILQMSLAGTSCSTLFPAYLAFLAKMRNLLGEPMRFGEGYWCVGFIVDVSRAPTCKVRLGE